MTESSAHDQRLNGRTALVTGGASGIGLEVTRLLAAAGATVIVIDVSDAPVELPPNAHREQMDVADSAAWDRLAGGITAEHRRLDVACLNAGVLTGEQDITTITDATYHRALRANVDGVFFGVRALTPLLSHDDGGSIVVTASLAGLIPSPSDPVYGLTKHAVVGFVRSAAPQLRSRGIRINAVCPGLVDTPLVPDDVRDSLRTADFPLIPTTTIAEAILAAAVTDETGQAYVCQVGREPIAYQFRNVPGPRGPGAEGRRPPIWAADDV